MSNLTPKFSILTPVYLYSMERKKMLDRCLRNVINQTFPDFEHIIINDGSKKPFRKIEAIDNRQVVLEQEHSDRAIALNLALKESKGEWICFLDSDDEYLSIYLEVIDQMIKAYPDYKVFNFGSIHIHRNFNVTLKPVFRPERLEKGHVIFRSGGIVNGTFVFHRSCYEKLGGFPHVTNCWDFAIKAFEEFPEIKEMYRKDDGRYGEIGNPWGNDAYYFYKLTRQYFSQPVDTWLYIVHPRQGYQL